jgi:hypothetical protein
MQKRERLEGGSVACEPEGGALPSIPRDRKRPTSVLASKNLKSPSYLSKRLLLHDLIHCDFSLKKSLWILCAVVLTIAIGGAGLFYYRARNGEQRLRALIVEALSERFESDVELASLHIRLFPKISGEGQDLTLRHRGRTDVPPLIRIEHFSFGVGILGLLRPTKHISIVEVREMVITIPPREFPEAGNEIAAEPSEALHPKALPAVTVDKLICSDADIIILPKDPAKEPLDWAIHNLVIYDLTQGNPSKFLAELTNGKPVGDIATQGDFGPWNAEDPGGTNVSGQYKFTNADLGPFPGIGGTLSSTGEYSGVLSKLEVAGETDTPNFSLDEAGSPVPLHTDFSATVDGTNGDTLLHAVNGTLLHTLILASGSVVGVPGKGHLITIDASVPKGRIEDVLSLAIKSRPPLMIGPLKIKAKISIPPGREKVIEKVTLDGQFGVEDAAWSSPVIREQLKTLSRRAQGKPEEQDIGSAISNLRGSMRLENGVIDFRRLSFGVRGAQIDLAGTYAISGGEMDLKGHLRLDSKLSGTVTGAKSFFLKAFDPFFSKNGAGTELPIAITGTRDHPVFDVSVFRKQIKKTLTTSHDSSEKKD